MLRIIASYRHSTSIFDDFSHYERRQEEEEVVRKVSLAGRGPWPNTDVEQLLTQHLGPCQLFRNNGLQPLL